MKPIFFLLTVIALASCQPESLNPVQPVSCTLSPSEHVLSELLQALCDRYASQGVPGLSIHITDESGSWSGAAGYAEALEQIPMTACTPQYAASIQKTLTAAMVLQLVDQGQLSLETKIEPFLSEKIKGYLPAVESITIEHLLLHTSGWPDVFELDFLTDFFNHPTRPYTPEELLAYLKGRKVVGLPGETHYYSDANYIILSMIIDSLADDHVRMMEEEILNPLGLESTWYHQGVYPNPPGLAAGYADLYGDGVLHDYSFETNHITSQIPGAGGLITTPVELSLMLEELMYGSLVSDSLKQYLRNTSVENTREGWINDHYGPGVMVINDSLTGRWIGHSGSQLGASAFVFTHPEKGITVAAMTNLGTFLSRQSQQKIFGELWTELIYLLDS